MPCPHASTEPADDSRRSFLKAAVAIGGSSALAACAQLTETSVESSTPQFPQGPSDRSTLPERQHAWNEYLVTDRQGNIVVPQHQVFLFLDYVRDGVPTTADRETVETALQTLDRTYQRGTGDTPNAISNDGLLYTIGYSPAYFDRFDGQLPGSVDLPTPERVLSELGEDPTMADDFDALLHLGSDRAQIVLAVEEALFGGLDQLNGVTVETDLSGTFERVDRRTGFIGRGLPNEKLNEESIPERAPTSMGFKSAFTDTQPGEDKVSIPTGPFAEGTTQHVSRLELDLGSWYEQGHGDRVKRMFSPEHSATQVGEVGEALGNESGITEGIVDRTSEAADSKGLVGHAQKTARARDDDFEPIILRRGDFNAPAEPGAVLNFGALQAGISDFIETRRAMTRVRLEKRGGDAPDISDSDNGILGFIEVLNRANYLLPPRQLRALPPARP